MIETMKHVTVVCLAQDRQTAVEGLRDLETVHVTDCMPPSGEALDVLTRRSDALNRAVALLASREPAAQEDEGRSPAGVIEDVLAQAGEIVHLREKHTRLQRGLSQLAPWGSFSLDSIAELTASGLRVVLSTAREGEMPEVPDGAVLHVVSVKDKTVYFAVVAPEDVQLDLSGAALPEETNIEALHADLVECEQEMAACEAKLDVLAVAFPRLKEAQTVLADEVAFVRAREGMGADEKLVYLQGFVPERDMAALLGRAKNNGWAVRTEDVADDDPSVPVKITLPPMFRVAKPIFDFVGILPGYDENDVSVSVLVFLTLFFGMIVGDAGYGTIFLALALFAKAKIKAPDKQLILNLFILLSVVTVVWGWMTGNWFAIAAKRLPAFMHGIPVLTDASIRDKNVQWLCFLIAGIHLSMAHVWRAFVNLNRRRVALG
ncbi:MAG: hypothetical protein KAI66_21680, partial [Lentisphaeria bacterium]|nr:hypothetical protein [Lentisphaeria bacterium]